MPAEGACLAEPPRAVRAPTSDDAIAALPKPGDLVGLASVARLRDYLPPEVWEQRERFFYDGMQMQIGPCYRDYSPPELFTRHPGTAPAVGVIGVPEAHRVGLPFAPAQLDPDDADTAWRWAENRAWRYRAGGDYGSLSLSVVSPAGVLEQWRGSSFFVPLRGRADQPAPEHRMPSKVEGTWAAGGEAEKTRSGKECQFRQYGRADGRPDYFVMTSYSRKVERYPSPTLGTVRACLVDAAIGEGLATYGHAGGAYAWELGGVVDVFAPINLAKPVWPETEERNFGPYGISFADDRWELRRALVLEGRLQPGQQAIDATRSFVWYLDLQTLAPLYYVARDAKGQSAGVGVYAYRWSEDREGYPRWPDDPQRPVRVLDLMAEAFADWNEQHAVRHESGDAVSMPPRPERLDRRMSIGSMRIR